MRVAREPVAHQKAGVVKKKVIPLSRRGRDRDRKCFNFEPGPGSGAYNDESLPMVFPVPIPCPGCGGIEARAFIRSMTWTPFPSDTISTEFLHLAGILNDCWNLGIVGVWADMPHVLA